MGKVKKSIYRWCILRLVANKPSAYYLKSLFWAQNLMFRTTESLKRFEDLILKNVLIYVEHLQKALNAFGSAVKIEKRFLQV